MAPVVHLRSAVAVAGRFPALAGVDLSAQKGEVVAIFGPNGAGKTSLFRLLSGLLPLVEGNGSVGGFDLATERSSVHEVVGYLGHSSYFYDELTPKDNLSFFLSALRIDTHAMLPSLERCGITGRLCTTEMAKLSAGQKRRVGLAYLLARRPPLWLLDEPHTSLDQGGRELVESVITEAQQSGTCVLFSSHEESTALSIATRAIRMSGGIVVGEEQGLRPQSTSPFGQSDAHVA